MGVVASVSSTYSFPLVSGQYAPSANFSNLNIHFPGGHVGMVWGWFIPCLFVMPIAASMAELVSAMPWVSISSDKASC